MPSRPNLSIRRLMPPRRFSDEDLGGANNLELRNQNDAFLKSWLDHNIGRKRAYHKKHATEPIIATSALTHRDVVRPLPPLPNETPRSSSSLLCKCERHSDAECPLKICERRSPLCSRLSKDGSESSSLLSLPSTNGSEEYPALRLPRSRFYNPGSYEDLTRPSSVEREPIDGNRTGDNKPHHQGHTRELSLENFIQETDEAFKADLRLTEISLLENTKTIPLNQTKPTFEPPPPPPPPKEKPPLPAKDPRRRISQNPQGKPVFSHTPTAPLGPPPVSNVKRKKSKKGKKTKAMMKAQRKANAPRLAVKNVPRWTLTDNVSELLTGKLFHKLEADEFLTPDQIEAYRLRRISERQAQEQSNEDDPSAADTPVEPFYLDELSARIGSPSARDNASAETSSKFTNNQNDNNNEAHAISFSDDVVARDFSFERPLQHVTPIAPLRLSRVSRSTPRKQMAELPIIPESSATMSHLVDDELFFDTEMDDDESYDDRQSLEDSEFIYLQSSPHTATVPTFKHGSIRLAKSDLMPDPMLGTDEVLDWTAFQMAILGGAGDDWFSESDDTIRRREADDVNQLAEWWESWHFSSPGELVEHEQDYEASSPTSTISGEELPDLSSYDDMVDDNPYSSHHPWQADMGRSTTTKTRNTPQGLGINIDLAHNGKRKSSGYSNNQWRRDSEQKEVVISRDSLMSLPPSPMLDLRVIRSESGEMDVVPMGFNLGHDLGDYLKWETEHAFAGDFNL
ncbi:hypothetical protein F5Y16DRAFT_359810 [Xylariaceae sp. FL0255]|nr:hypothetical protein F5Y16DRAFT_359810 [Xylariaceae sp. FL0255]